MNDHISLVLKTVRKVNNLTQEEIAGEIGVSPGHIGSLEQGKANPSYEVMEKIVDKYDIDANLFFGRTQKNTKSINASTVKIMQNLLLEVNERMTTYARDIDEILTETDI